MAEIHATTLMGNNEIRDYETLTAAQNTTIKSGTFLTQSPDGGSWVLHSADVTKPIDGILRNDMEFGTNTTATVSIVVSGRVGATWLKTANGITDFKTKPAGGTKNYIQLLADIGITTNENTTNLYDV